MKILFCKISWMKYYKGACDEDTPINGGEFVKMHGFGHEELNFLPVLLDDKTVECVGFVEPKGTEKRRNTLHIERIEGCEQMKKEDFVNDVLVVWCATPERGGEKNNMAQVVGWYKHATVYRELQEWTLEIGEPFEKNRFYNVRANAEDCVLLPHTKRSNHKWNIPTAKYTGKYGFGQAMVWYAEESSASVRVERLINDINQYSGGNDIDVYPEELKAFYGIK